MSTMNSGFSGRGLPFHSLPSSRVIQGTASVEEALSLSGLNWDVAKVPAYHEVAGVFEKVPGKFVTQRADNHAALGVVGNQYDVFQNSQAFAFADELLGFGAEFEAAGAWNGGSNVFLVAKLPEGIKVQGEEDMDLYLQMVNAHNGSSAIAWYATPIRITCTNQNRLAIRSAVSSAKIRHTRTADQRVAQAAETLGLVDLYKRELEEGISRLQATDMDLEQVQGFFKELSSSERVQSAFRSTYSTSPTVTQGNAWGVINSVTEALQHAPARVTGAESRFGSNLDGVNQRVVERATRMLIRR